MDPNFSSGEYPNGVPMDRPYIPSYQTYNHKRDKYFDIFTTGSTLDEVTEFDENHEINTIRNNIMVSKKCKELEISESEYLELETSGAFKQEDKKNRYR